MVLLFVVCGWREEAVAGVFLRTYLVHSTYVFLYQDYNIHFYREAHYSFQKILYFVLSSLKSNRLDLASSYLDSHDVVT
jgi:hypothetical protein